MHILYVSQYFTPEIGAPAARVHELGREWVRTGHRVTVLTGFPNHPTGRIPEAYRRLLRRGTVRECVDGIDVVRTWLYPAPNRRPAERMLNYSSFGVSAVARGLWLERPDVVIGTSPQLLVPLAGWCLARRFRRPCVVEIRDLWPESLPASGVGRVGSPLYRALDALASFLYRSADLVVPVTQPFVAEIRRRAPEAQTVVVENGVDTDLFRPMGPSYEAKHQLGIGDRFVASYIGTIGAAHALGTVLEAAAILRARIPRMLFLMVGEGAEREQLEARARQAGLANVRFVGARPRDEIPVHVAASDLCLVHLRRSPLFETVLPSKMLEFMACARPVVVGVGGLTRALVEDSRAGLCVTPEDPVELAEAISRIHDDQPLGQKLGENGRRYVMEHFTREAKARVYLDALQRLCAA